MAYWKKKLGLGLGERAEFELHQILLKNGAYFEFLNFGGIITRLIVPVEGRWRDLVLGYADLNDYLENPAYLGAVIGRYANRIPKGQFNLNGKTYNLDLKDGMHLHGGRQGLSHQYWKVDLVYQNDQEALCELNLLSPEYPQSYPGNVEFKILYHFSAGGFLSLSNEIQQRSDLIKPYDAQLIIQLKGRPDKPTPLNLTHHSYFQLDGVGHRYEIPKAQSYSEFSVGQSTILGKAEPELKKIYNHSFQILSGELSEVDANSKLTGRNGSVDKRPGFDFRKMRKLGAGFEKNDPWQALVGGIDNNYIFGQAGEYKEMANVISSDSKVFLSVHSTLPALQFYTANSIHLVGGKAGQAYHPWCSFCLEPQFTPNSVNLDSSDSTIFKPDRIFDHKIAYQLRYG